MAFWIDFLRKYGPVSKNDNMYDETMQRLSKRYGYEPIRFEHPFKKRVFQCYENQNYTNIILTGTAGDGKTHLCREVWELLGGHVDRWSSDDSYLSLTTIEGKNIHFIRDLSSWAPQLNSSWNEYSDKYNLMNIFIDSCYKNSQPIDFFLIAANDGQLLEVFKRLSIHDETGNTAKFRHLLENLLVNDRQNEPDLNLQLFNLSRGSSADLFDSALQALLNHNGWTDCLNKCICKNECPVIKNYRLLEKEQIKKRLRTLFEICDCNNLHLPIRQTLLFLSNSLLGHPDAKDYLLNENDVQRIIANKAGNKGCLYSNAFGDNLPENKRSGLSVYDYFERFQIGFETTNRIDNLIIFGKDDESQKDDYNNLILADPFLGSDESFENVRRDYIEATDEIENDSSIFLKMLIKYRRAIFFNIPSGKEEVYKLWNLTIFRFAGEYINQINGNDFRFPKSITARIVQGLNRVFTGMLINSDDKLFIAISSNYSQSSISRIFLNDISVKPNKGEKILIEKNPDTKRVYLKVFFDNNVFENIELNLIRYEFLSRVAEDGALPASFSRECNEDILAFKSRLIEKCRQIKNETEDFTDESSVEVKILSSINGKPEERTIEFSIQ